MYYKNQRILLRDVILSHYNENDSICRQEAHQFSKQCFRCRLNHKANQLTYKMYVKKFRQFTT